MKTLTGKTLIERRWLLFLLLALFFRGLYVEWKVEDVRSADAPGRWFFDTPDTHSYFDPIDRVMEGGDYKPDYRMPGVGVPYWAFRLFLDPVASRDAMVVLQWLLSGISVYVLALLALRLTGSHTTALITYSLFLLSTFSSWYDTSMSSDSLAPSAFILQVFLFQQAFDKQNRWMLSAAGLILTWIIFIRPVAALLLIPACILVHMYWGKSRSLRPLVLFLIPFAVIETAWVVRNWRVNHEFNPLTNEGMMPAEIADRPLGYLMRFLGGYGGAYIWWQPGADIRWYGLWHGAGEVDDEGRKADPPPEYAYVPGYNQDSLLAISSLIRSALDGDLEPSDSIAAIAKANATLDRYTALHAEGAPFTHHVVSRFLMVRHMVVQNGTETLFNASFSALPLWMKLFKLLQIVLYYFAFIMGGTAAVVMLWQWRRATSLLATWIPIIALYMVFIYPLGLKMAEWRFMVHVFPLGLLLATCMVVPKLEVVMARVRTNRNNSGRGADQRAL